nr:reverse transcriptase N-terminal domain-containing protein [Pseudomonas allii]
MQIRIAKACREGNWRRVKALQRMLTRSRSARYLAYGVSLRTKANARRESIVCFGIHPMPNGERQMG